ncbi:hypothetical protein EAO28_30905 [Klebsiella pneumoniae]|uniref:Mobile element protein n=1 Tax=Klebsiella pneumoniae TaxID=573 RepID=A0A3P2EF37_KLEPN|nr:hypothetical protein EAO28_30905 [Klebsiella pneumoniae]
MGSCAAPSAKGDDKFITTDYLQQCRSSWVSGNAKRLSRSAAERIERRGMQSPSSQNVGL